MAFGTIAKEVDSQGFMNNTNGGKLEGHVTAPGPASYTTGGDDLDLATALGLANTDFLDVLEGIATDGTQRCIWLRSTGKALVYDLAGSEIAATTNLSGKTYLFKWVSKK